MTYILKSNRISILEKITMMKDFKILGLIPARGGSRGIPRKNIIPVAGKPLIAYTIEEAIKSRYIDRVIVSTDDEENAETLKKGVDFLLKYDDHSQLRTIRPVTPYPGSELYYYAIKKGLLKDVEDFYENKHTNSDLLSVNFTELSDDEFNRLLFEANKTLLKNYYNHMMEKQIDVVRKLYFEKNTAFRGFRQT